VLWNSSNKTPLLQHPFQVNILETNFMFCIGLNWFVKG
jgi:hypothetical protein